ncbi:TIGR02301 family protein [Mangrovicella endophytica]|uniref:TIGR02301 family protein n=1 Tax=Mangrovicella endophytica TaxID=2066697 RepID=UPI001FDF15E9|nr:TIGR02301 family protein [Mangrovicella endophytica]
MSSRLIRAAVLPPLLVAAVYTSLASASARAQEPTEPAPAAVQAPVQPSNAPFMKPLGRLSSILGSVHFLRRLCGDTNAETYRTKMGELLAAQPFNEVDKRRLIASFNDGYRAFESTYRRCTPAARVAVDRYLSEGATLSREISARYGN